MTDRSYRQRKPYVPPCRWPECTLPAVLNRAGHSKGFCGEHGPWRSALGRAKTMAHYEARRIDGRRISADGYVTIFHQGAVVAEHRVVMEQMLGRPILKGENVHHKNGIRTDNRPQNLELWIRPQPAGQRASDIACGHCGAPYWPRLVYEHPDSPETKERK